MPYQTSSWNWVKKLQIQKSCFLCVIPIPGYSQVFCGVFGLLSMPHFNLLPILLYFSIKICIKDILWIIVVKAAVIVLYLFADKRIIYLYQHCYNVWLMFSHSPKYKPFVHFPNIPMGWHGIPGIWYIVKNAFANTCFPDKAITDLVNIVTMVNICQIIYFLYTFPAKGIDYGIPVVFCLPRHIFNQAAGKK